MPSISSFFSTAALVALAHGHAVILNAQGLAGSPNSVGFQVQPDIARNCTSISPCQQDATIIRDQEFEDNVTNECGRTELNGNIDIGENTENAIAAGKVTQVKSGSQIDVTIHQVNADGAGPFVCDLEETGNTGVISQNLTVLHNVPGVNGLSQAKEQDFHMTVIMPQNFKCTGSSQGNICTVRCRNNALAGPFGGCFPVQQTDTVATKNTAATIDTAASLDAVLAQVNKNQKDLPAAINANQEAGTDAGLAAANIVTSILNAQITSKAAPTQTPAVKPRVVADAIAGEVPVGAAAFMKRRTPVKERRMM